MKHFISIIKSAIFDFSRSKGRTFLTSLGILIGVMSVVLLMAMGLGLKKYISNQFDALGANLVYVMPGNEQAMMTGAGFVGGIKFDDKDVDRIRRVEGVELVAPAYAKPGAIMEANGKSATVELIASTADVNAVMNLQPELGRLIEVRDNNKRTKTIVISPKIAEKLFGTTDEALGKKVSIGL